MEKSIGTGCYGGFVERPIRAAQVGMKATRANRVQGRPQDYALLRCVKANCVQSRTILAPPVTNPEQSAGRGEYCT